MRLKRTLNIVYKQLLVAVKLCLLANTPLCAQVPRTEDSLLQSAIHAYDQNEIEQSVLLLNHLLTRRDTNLVDSTNAILYLYLSKAYEKKKDFSKAFHLFNRYQEIEKTLFDQDKTQDANTVQQKVTAINEKKIQTQELAALKNNEEEMLRKQSILWGISAGILLLILSGLFSISSYRKKRKIHQEAQKATAHELDFERLNAQRSGTLKERDKITRQLHDEVLPLLYEINNQLANLNDPHKEKGTIQPASIEEVRQIIDKVCRELEDTTFSMTFQDGKAQTLEIAIRQLIENIPPGHPLQITVHQTGKSRLNTDQEKIVYRIVQELIQNIIKHAQAEKASILLNYTKVGLNLSVEDNGKGFSALPVSKGIGLNNIKQRVAHLQGTLQVNTESGVKYTIYIPYAIRIDTTSTGQIDNML